jgi:hypothetical protein
MAGMTKEQIFAMMQQFMMGMQQPAAAPTPKPILKKTV